MLVTSVKHHHRTSPFAQSGPMPVKQLDIVVGFKKIFSGRVSLRALIH
jgi:hypothetical protein